MPDFLYLDIETIPTSDPKIIAEIAANVTPPASMKKPETIEKWEAEEKPKAVAKAVANTSFDGAYGQICCICGAWGNSGIFGVHTGNISEVAALNGFIEMVDKRRPSNEQPIVVGHYVAGFDIRFIWQRAFVLGVQLPHWFPRDPKPWSNEVNDTMVMWAGSRDTISMDNLCRALGMEGKGDITGADVAGLWAAKEYEKVAEYCRQDVEKTRQIHKKMLVSMGGAA